VTRRLAVIALAAAAVLGAACAFGTSASGATTVVQFDGAAWKGQPGLPVPVAHHRALALPKSLVVLGGQDRRGILQAGVYRSVLTAKGECGIWVKDAALPAALSDHGAVEVGGRVYVAGGLKANRQSSVATDEIWGAVPATDGRIRAWEPAGRLPEPLQGHAMAVVGRRMYVIGGMASAGCRTAVWVAEAGGRIAGWKQVTPLPVPLANATAVAVGNFLLVMGGQSPGSGKTLVMPTAYVGPVGADGGVHTWYLASTKLPGPWLGFGRCQAAGVVWHDTVFCFGGQDPLWFLIDSIAIAPFDEAKGELGGWGVASGPADMHQLSAAVVWKDWVYLVGGTVHGAVTEKVLRGTFAVSEREEE
jgi:hypothetical protein